jgi:Leucine-rich repeat (LRR) protein
MRAGVSGLFVRSLLSTLACCTLLLLLIDLRNVDAIQSNVSCAAVPRDKRQQVCTCVKQLQLRCTFVLDIREISPKDLDLTLRPIYYGDVALERVSNADDPDDINVDFMKKDPTKIYLYFPNFAALNSPYIRLTLIRFMYVPSFAFVDKPSLMRSLNAVSHLSSASSLSGGGNSNKAKSIPSIIFELSEIFDFGIDKHAFFNLLVDELIFEGPFNQISVHEEAFEYSAVNELTIGCYCIECETFVGDCRVLFNQKSMRRTTMPKSRAEIARLAAPELLAATSNATQSLRRLKLYGVKLGSYDTNAWSLDELPDMQHMEYLEISNLIAKKNNELVEFKAGTIRNGNAPKLAELVLKNDGIRQLRKTLIALFPNLKRLSLEQNKIEQIDADAFSMNPQLSELSLGRNRLRSVKRGTFKPLAARLTRLALNENAFESLDDFGFDTLGKLEYLDLTRNRLSTLGESTFKGLTSLRELYLSYNPIKRIEPNAFRTFSIDAPKFARLDLISNAEQDWFVFDDADVCLLAHFRCETQIHIDIDQRCNCFVKYVNEIGQSKMYTSQLEHGADDPDKDSAWFKPCSVHAHTHGGTGETHESAQRQKGELAFYEEHGVNEYRHSRDPAALDKSAFEAFGQNKMVCSKIDLNKCFASMSDEERRLSCLHNKFSLAGSSASSSVTNGGGGSAQMKSDNVLVVPANSDMHQIEPIKNKNMDNQLLHDNQDPHHDLISPTAKSRSSANAKSNKMSADGGGDDATQRRPTTSAYSRGAVASKLDENWMYLLIGIAVVGLIALSSFFMSIYLIAKRNTIRYHTTDSGYPNDER